MRNINLRNHPTFTMDVHDGVHESQGGTGPFNVYLELRRRGGGVVIGT